MPADSFHEKKYQVIQPCQSAETINKENVDIVVTTVTELALVGESKRIINVPHAKLHYVRRTRRIETVLLTTIKNLSLVGNMLGQSLIIHHRSTTMATRNTTTNFFNDVSVGQEMLSKYTPEVGLAWAPHSTHRKQKAKEM